MLAVRRSPNLSFTQACVTFVTGRLLKATHQHPSDCTADVGSMTAVMAELYCSLLMIGLPLQQNMTFFLSKIAIKVILEPIFNRPILTYPRSICPVSICIYVVQYAPILKTLCLMPHKMFGVIYNHHTPSESVSQNCILYIYSPKNTG